jgi:hypothetical protein
VHIDAPWSNLFVDNGRRDTRHFDPKALDSLDWWIKCLKDEGIYVWLDLVYMRTLTDNDGVTVGFDEIKKNHGYVNAFSYFNQDVQRLMREFQHQYLSHVNRYTRLAYKDDPAVLAVLITNENDLTQHGGNLMLPNKNHPVHNAMFTRGYKAFAREHGLAESRVFQTWLPGPSKLFLNDVEHQFNQSMIEDLRNLGVKAPLATTHSWGNESLYSLPSLTDGDVIDVHAYGESEAMTANPHYDPNYLAWLAAAQVHGKPLTITEWNVPYPLVDRFTAPLYLASIASLQGWSAPMLYNYSQAPLATPRRIDVWSSYIDPALTGVMPAAALAYRQGHVSPARTTYCLMLNSAQFFDRALNPKTSAALRTLTEQSKLTIGIPSVKELPWLKATEPAPHAMVISDPDHDFLPMTQSFVRSDTGELLRNWKYGIQLIDTPKTQAVSGWIEGKTLKTRDASFLFHNKKAVVALSSMDNQPLTESASILITAMARAVAPTNSVPFLTEPVEGTISLRATTPGLMLLSLGPDGRTVDRSAPARDKDALTIQLPAGRGTHWYVLTKSETLPETRRSARN